MLSATLLLSIPNISNAANFSGQLNYVYVGSGYVFVRMQSGQFCFASGPRTHPSAGAVLSNALIADKPVTIYCAQNPNNEPGNYLEVTVQR